MDSRSSCENLAEAWMFSRSPAAPRQDPKSLKGAGTHLNSHGQVDDEDDSSEEDDDEGEREVEESLPAEDQSRRPKDDEDGDTNRSPLTPVPPLTPLTPLTVPSAWSATGRRPDSHPHPLPHSQIDDGADDKNDETDKGAGAAGGRSRLRDSPVVRGTSTLPVMATAGGASRLRDSPVARVASTLPVTATTASRGAAVGLNTPSPRKVETSPPGIASMPIRCIVEHVSGPVTFDTTSGAACDFGVVGQDAFAILPVNTPLRHLVGAALAKLGYSAADSVPAKGAIQLKNWKPLSFEVITDDRSATIDDILRELKEYTLRIRLSSQPRHKSVEEMKEKLLQLLLTTSHSMLVDSGCPVHKGLLMSLSKGENFSNIPDDLVSSFNTWYSTQISKSPKSNFAPVAVPACVPENLSKKEESETEKISSAVKTEADPPKPNPCAATPDVKAAFSSSSSSASSVSSLPSPASSLPPQHPVQQQFLHNGRHFQHSSLPSQQQVQRGIGAHSLQPAAHNPALAPSKTRIRTSFDPEHEIPRLQKWFHVSQHPSREQMMRYMQELNNLESRKGRRPLDLTNIIYWFKNARAAQRRATKTQDDSFENEENVDVSNGERTTPVLGAGNGGAGEGGAVPPYLPNKNAIYIVPYPFHSTHPASASSNPLLSTPDPMGDSNDEPCDLSIRKLVDQSPIQQDHRSNPTGRKGSDVGLVNGELLSAGGGRSNGSHSRKSSPTRNGYFKSSHEDEYCKSLSVFNGQEIRKTSTPLSKDRGREREPSAEERNRKLIEKHYQQFRADQDIREHQRLVMDFKKEVDVSDADSCQSHDTDEGGRLRIQEEEELEYSVARVRAEMGLGLSQLAATSEASMAALSLAQMSQPQAMLSIAQHHINPLAMYYNLAPRYYHSPSSHPSAHHHHSQATAAMVAALSGSGHMNGHATGVSGGGGSHHITSSSSNPQSPAASGGRSAPNQPPTNHPSLSSQGRDRSSEPRKRRTRVFIDPLTEIPRLEKWFQEDTHPSAYMIDKYTETLNKAEYRQKFPKLEAKNIQLWFKNHRAKVKRQRVGGPEGGDSVCDSPPPNGGGSRSQTPLNVMAGGREESGCASGASTSPEKHSSDVDQGLCDDDDVEEGEQ